MSFFGKLSIHRTSWVGCPVFLNESLLIKPGIKRVKTLHLSMIKQIGIKIATHKINDNDAAMTSRKNIEQDKGNREVRISFRNHGNLSLLKYDYIQFTLKELIMKRGTRLMIDLTGVKFIDSNGIDLLNLLSRLGKKYESSIALVGVEPELNEMLRLVKKYTVFDINHIEPVKVVAI